MLGIMRNLKKCYNMGRFDTFVDKLLYANYVRQRNEFAKRQFAEQLKNVCIRPLTKEEKRRVDEIWWGVKVDYRWFAYYNEIHKTHGVYFNPFFVPANVYYANFDLHFSNCKQCKVVDDKSWYGLFFNDVRRPHELARKISGEWVDENYELISVKDVIKKCLQCERGVIIKPSYESEGGNGIFLWHNDGVDDIERLLNNIDNCVVQELLVQHPQMEHLHAKSVNTVRIMSLVFNSKVNVLSSIVRMGIGDNEVDNATAGGIFCGVNNDGTLKNVGWNLKGEKFTRHPDGVRFESITIPNFNELIMMVQKLAPRLMKVSKLVSWDFAILEDGHPVLIEANLSWGDLNLHQMSNGPIFGNLTETVIKDVFKEKRNRLFNKIL